MFRGCPSISSIPARPVRRAHPRHRRLLAGGNRHNGAANGGTDRRSHDRPSDTVPDPGLPRDDHG
jgi:hypothetical protein